MEIRALLLALCLAGCSHPATPALLPFGSNDARASTKYAILFSFSGKDGSHPIAPLTVLHGTLYGTTPRGGMKNEGTVFSITTTGTQRVIHNFGGPSDGLTPAGQLCVLGATLYGTTAYGGTHGGLGIAFGIDDAGRERVLYSFGAQANDGANPQAGLTVHHGAFYGTTTGGGASYFGTVFTLDLTGAEHVVHAFGKMGDGADPQAALTVLNGTLYGTTYAGGGTNGGGTVFGVTRAGRERILYRFASGAHPAAGLTVSNGILYGTTLADGTRHSGTVFSIDKTGTLRVLHSFGLGTDGAYPASSLTVLNGELYGTTVAGGANGGGTVFSIDTAGAERVVYSFGSSGDGATPDAGLTVLNGTLYGTTEFGGGRHKGVVFALTP